MSEVPVEADHPLAQAETVAEIGVHLLRQRAPAAPSAGASGRGVGLRPSFRIAPGCPASRSPTTSGVAEKPEHGDGEISAIATQHARSPSPSDPAVALERQAAAARGPNSRTGPHPPSARFESPDLNSI